MEHKSILWNVRKSQLKVQKPDQNRSRLSCWLVSAIYFCYTYIFPLDCFIYCSVKNMLNTKMRFETKCKMKMVLGFCSVFVFFPFFVFFGLKVLDLFCCQLLRKFVQENAYLSIVKTKQKYTSYTPGHKCMFLCLRFLLFLFFLFVCCCL